ncbi:MAG: transcriptional regulator [Candidatus Thermoplasmatota archaeon]|nr:transcriptional regulator [Candidatus Thermoplasmatota archaeon]
MGSSLTDAENFRRFVLTQLAEEITDTPFKSSIRLIIIMSLGVSKRMRLTDIMKLTGCGKGSISNHIDKLEKSGFVTTHDASFFTSPRIVVEITKKGEEFYNSYLSMLEKIIYSQVHGDGKNSTADSKTEDSSNLS